MRRALRGIAIAVALAAPAMSAHAACTAPTRATFDQKLSIEGVLRPGKGNHEAQGPFEYIYLALDKPLCVDPSATANNDEPSAGTTTAVERIQVAGQAAATGNLPMGKQVVLTGTLFAAHTMWHVETVLIDAESIDVK